MLELLFTNSPACKTSFLTESVVRPLGCPTNATAVFSKLIRTSCILNTSFQSYTSVIIALAIKDISSAFVILLTIAFVFLFMINVITMFGSKGLRGLPYLKSDVAWKLFSRLSYWECYRRFLCQQILPYHHSYIVVTSLASTCGTPISLGC